MNAIRKLTAALCCAFLTAGCGELPTEFEMAQEQEQRILVQQEQQEQLLLSDRSEPDRPYAAHQAPARQRESGSRLFASSSGQLPSPTVVKGIYVSGYTAGDSERMERLIRLIRRSELNAVVIDIKNDWGHVTYRSSVPLAKETGADRRRHIRDFPGLVARLKREDVYVIGRIVTFRDPHLAASRSETAMKRKDGSRWRDSSGVAWVDPYKKDVQQYNLDIAKEAVSHGVDEIQFDYVRFPDNGKRVDQEVFFDNPDGTPKADVIAGFLREARNELHPLGAYVSADVFGMTTSSEDDMGIGQQWAKIACEVDYISPMIYPSHYSSGNYGVRYPDLNPYAIVHNAVKDALERNKIVEAANFSGEEERKAKPAEIRPWYQAFTASWLEAHQRYGKAEVEAQIRAAKQLGVEQYLLWNPRSRYDFLE